MKNLSSRMPLIAGVTLSLASQRSLAFAPFPFRVNLPAHIQCNPTPSVICKTFKPVTFLRLSSSSPSTLPAPSMRVSELKKELESYGISTKSFFEKSELVEAVEKARAEGKTPMSSSSSTTEESKSRSDADDKISGSREERLQKEMEKCNAMKASELKAELKSYGISTSSFFEKGEFVKAVAEARVDGATQKSNNSSSENYAEYSNVEVITDDSTGPKKRSKEQNQNQNQSGADPFSAGMGGMGGIADMMKNMGGMGGNPFGSGMGGNPFGGGMGGGNPFGGGMGGDAMKKAQQMMSNPKVREIIMKAQSNPKIMKAVQECIANPMAFSKYQNDPEVGEMIKELQKVL